jgi:NAD(P)-dependent dehydrogenase (short-subunit alcohol dehydrogenase family)
VISGAAGFLGSHFCQFMLEAQATVHAWDQDEGQLKELKSKIKDKNLFIRKIDICHKKSVQKAVDEMKGCDVFIANAAIASQNLNSREQSDAEGDSAWARLMQVNLEGMWICVSALGKKMIDAKKGGSIVLVSSIYGAMAPDSRIYQDAHYQSGEIIGTPVSYSTSKGGVIAMARHLAVEWAHHGIIVNSLSPGGVENQQNERFKKAYAQRIPIQRMARPSDLRGPLLFLSSSASSYFTGQNMLVDGGLSAW